MTANIVEHILLLQSTNCRVQGLFFKEWLEHGLDRHSVISDPLFIDPTTGDYRVKPDSLALKFGFKNFDMDNFGLLPDFPKKWLEQETSFMEIVL